MEFKSNNNPDNGNNHIEIQHLKESINELKAQLQKSEEKELKLESRLKRMEEYVFAAKFLTVVLAAIASGFAWVISNFNHIRTFFQG